MLALVRARIKPRRLFSFICGLLIIKKKDEGIRLHKAEPRAIESNSHRVELSPTHGTGNMYLSGIQNFYGLMTFLSLF